MTMLVLKRKVGDSIAIGNDVLVTVKKINPMEVHLLLESLHNVIVLKCKVGEVITISNDVTMKIKRTGPMAVHLFIEAPRNVVILRTELINEINESKATK